MKTTNEQTLEPVTVNRVKIDNEIIALDVVRRGEKIGSELHRRIRYNICTAYAREQTWRSRIQRSENDRAPTAGLSSDCDDLACGVASGGEAKS